MIQSLNTAKFEEKSFRKQLEENLSELIIKDKHNWVKVYLLLKEVEEKALWQGDYHSFTAWLKSFCLENKIHESVLWNRRRAGKVYEEYIINNTNSDTKPKPLEEISVPMESLVLIDQIIKNSSSTSEISYLVETKNNLIEKALNGELNREDLRQAYKTCKILKEKNKNNVINNESNKENRKKVKSKITALDIVTVLNNPLWIQELEVRDKQVKFYKPFIEKEKYKAYTEFPVYTGSSHLSRRIDILIVENLTPQYVWDLTFHGIEIKVNKNDLLNDCKYTEYADFVDFMWLAIPYELLDIALETKFTECGIIVIQNNKAEIIEKSTSLNPSRKKETMNTLLLKIM